MPWSSSRMRRMRGMWFFSFAVVVVVVVVRRALSTTSPIYLVSLSRDFGQEEKFRLLAEIYRGREERYDESALVIAGLHNYKELGKLSW